MDSRDEPDSGPSQSTSVPIGAVLAFAVLLYLAPLLVALTEELALHSHHFEHLIRRLGLEDFVLDMYLPLAALVRWIRRLFDRLP